MIKNDIGLRQALFSLFAKLQEKGIRECSRIAFLRFFRDIFPRIIAPLFFIPSYILYKFGVRFLPIKYISNIGHLSAEPDCYIKEELLGLHPHYKAIILAPKHKVANRHLLSYWCQYIRIITSPTLCALLYPLSQQKLLQYDTTRYLMTDYEDGTVLVHSINTKWAGKPPLLTLRESDRVRGWIYLQKLHIPEDSWFVCIHAREPGARPQDIGHTNRNVDIDTYLLAIESIVERGGWCIRMGDPSMKPLPPMKKVIDYAHHSFRSDFMDIFLCSNTKFYLGCASGLIALPVVFGVPCALANQFPISERPYSPSDIEIPKLLWLNSEGRNLSFQEALEHYLGSFHHPDSYYINAGITVMDNSPEDIRDLVIEMLDTIAGTMIYSAEDERLQEKFRSLYRPGHYSYGATSRIGNAFLHKYAYLL